MSFNCFFVADQLTWIFRLIDSFQNISLFFYRQITPKISGFSLYFGRNSSQVVNEYTLVIDPVDQVVELMLDGFEL